MSEFQQYMVRLCGIKTQELTVFCGENLYSRGGDILLDTGLLHNWLMDFVSLSKGLLGSTPASQWYKGRLCHLKTHEFTVFCRSCIRYQAGNISLNG